MAVTDKDYEEGLRAREVYRERCLELLEGIDPLLTPTVPFVAPRADTNELTIRDAVIRFTHPFKVLGWPALAMPCGPAEDGLPASVQLAGRRGDDALVLATGEQLERACRQPAKARASASARPESERLPLPPAPPRKSTQIPSPRRDSGGATINIDPRYF